MDLAILVYAASVIGNFKITMCLIFCLGISVFFMYLLITHIERKNRISLKLPIIALSVSAVLLIALPSERVMYTMAGAYAAQQIATDPDAKRIGAKVISIIESRLNELSK